MINRDSLCGILTKYRTINYRTIADSVREFMNFIRWYEEFHGMKPWE